MMIPVARTAPALAAIVAIALALRLAGLQYGLPAVYNPDEVAIMARALSFATGTLNPHNFLYPTFFFYLLFAWVGAYLAILWITGGVPSLSALPALYFTSPTGIYTAGRALGVVAGTATVVGVFRLAARLADTRTAIAAAAFLAVAPLHVRDSHYVKHDVPATLAIVLAYLAIARIWPLAASAGLTTRQTIVAAAACGAAFSIHYYCVFLAIPLTLAVCCRWRAAGWTAVGRQVLVAAAVSAAVFFALSPFILVEPATAWRDITANRQIVVDRAVTAGAFAPALRYAEMIWRDTLGVPAVALALAGAAWMLAAAPARALFLLAFPLPFLAFIANTAPATRYLNPVTPFLAIFAAWCLSSAAARVGRPVVFWAGLVLAAAPAALASLQSDLFFRQEDTRAIARALHRADHPGGGDHPDSAVFGRADAVAEGARRGTGAQPRQCRAGLSQVPAAAVARALSQPGVSPDLSGARRARCRKDLRGPLPARRHRRARAAPAPRRGVRRAQAVQCQGSGHRPLPGCAGRRGPSDCRVLTLQGGSDGRRAGADRPFPAQHRYPDRRRAGASWSAAGDLADRWAWLVEPLRAPWQDCANPSPPGRGRCRWLGTPGPATGATATRSASSGSSRRRPAGPIALPMGAVYEATMRCNLHCEFCYVGDLLNLEGEWRQELTLEACGRRSRTSDGFQISLTGGEIFMRKDIMSVLDLFRDKGYACGYLTTNGTIITEERAEALADLAARGFLKHISVSIDGPGEMHDVARGLKGTFERTTAGLRRLQAAARRRHAPLRVSINTTVAHETLEALDQMVEVAEELGVDAIGLNHLMFSTPEEVAETVRLIDPTGATDASAIATFVTADPGLDVERVRVKVAELEAKCKRKNVLFDFRPKVHPQLVDNYYTPGAKLDGRCLYPFLHARVSFSGKMYFCPFIRVEVGDLTQSSLEDIWNGDRYVAHA